MSDADIKILAQEIHDRLEAARISTSESIKVVSHLVALVTDRIKT